MRVTFLLSKLTIVYLRAVFPLCVCALLGSCGEMETEDSMFKSVDAGLSSTEKGDFFSVVFIGDSGHLIRPNDKKYYFKDGSAGTKQLFRKMMKEIASRKKKLNLKLVSFVGDMTHYNRKGDEWDLIEEGMEIIEDKRIIAVPVKGDNDKDYPYNPHSAGLSFNFSPHPANA